MKKIYEIFEYKNIIYLGLNLLFDTKTKTIFIVKEEQTIEDFTHIYKEEGFDYINRLSYNNKNEKLYDLIVEQKIIPINIEEKINNEYIRKQKINYFLKKIIGYRLFKKDFNPYFYKIKDILYQDEEKIIFLTNFNWIFIWDIKDYNIKKDFYINSDNTTLLGVNIKDLVKKEYLDNFYKYEEFFEITPEIIFFESKKFNINKFIS